MIVAPTFCIHLYWSEDKQEYEPEPTGLSLYEQEIELLVQENHHDLSLRDYLRSLAIGYYTSNLSHPKTLPVLQVNPQYETSIEHETPDSVFQVKWCFHNIPEEQKIRPHRAVWSSHGQTLEERFSFPSENEQERVMDITYKMND